MVLQPKLLITLSNFEFYLRTDQWHAHVGGRKLIHLEFLVESKLEFWDPILPEKLTVNEINC